MGIEPTLSAWEAEVLPLNYTRETASYSKLIARKVNWEFLLRRPFKAVLIFNTPAYQCQRSTLLAVQPPHRIHILLLPSLHHKPPRQKSTLGSNEIDWLAP